MTPAVQLAKKVVQFELDYPPTQGTRDAEMTIPGGTWAQMVEWAYAVLRASGDLGEKPTKKTRNAV